jgi:hypothetical protein
MTVPRCSAWAASISTVSALALAAAANTTASAQVWCGTDDLALSRGELTTTEFVGQDELQVILTNISQQSCTLQGYPGVDVVGPDVPTWGPVFSLARQSGDPEPFTLEPGASATSILTIGAPSAPEDFWYPTTLVVTPPDATTQLQMPWIPYTPVLRQDSATSPATYIGPLQPSA